MIRLILLLLPLFLSLPVASLADSAKLLGKSGDWESFAYAEKGGKVCYVASQPKHSSGAPKARSAAFLTITHRTSDKSIGVVSLSQGFAFKKDAPLLLDIGGTHFDLYASGDTAWSRNDKAVVAALLKARNVVMHGTPAKGDPVADSYSLDGLAQQYAEINKACGVK